MKMQERCRNSWRTRPSRNCGRTGTTSLSMTASKASPSSARRRAFQATKRRAGKNAHSRSKRGTLATLDRERPWVHGTMPLTCSRGSCSLCGICSKQHLTSAMMQTVTDCLILCTRWRQSTCHLTGLARSPLRANHSKPSAASAAGGRLSTGSPQSIGF